MRTAVAAVAVAVLAACASMAERGATGRGAQLAVSTFEQSDESGVAAMASATGDLGPGDELLVMLPAADGSSGAVMLRNGEHEMLVDQPYSALTLRAAGAVQPSTLDSGAVAAQFSEALAALPQRPTEFTLYFSEARNRFTEGSLAKLDEIFAAIARYPAPEISITGYTDTAGPAGRNERLSLARARRARDEFVRRGIPADRIVSVSGRGERELLVPTEDGVSEPRNRRVVISVR
jgi:outer membrane protein OmpA-like peptidoglycan-associated protein